MEDNLPTLDVEQLGAVNVRRMSDDELPDGTQRIPLEDQLAEMVVPRDEGKITGVGISNATLDQVGPYGRGARGATPAQVGLA